VLLPKPAYIKVTPPNPFPYQSVLLEWAPVKGATFYRVRLDNQTVGDTENTTYMLDPPAEGWMANKVYTVGVRAMNPAGYSDWTENIFTVQLVVYVPGPTAPTLAALPTKPVGKMELSSVVPMLPHPLVSVFNIFGQVAGVYTLSLLMIVSGLVIITLGLGGFRWS
jgi:hypothetical protein